jgi:hypothetical protein
MIMKPTSDAPITWHDVYRVLTLVALILLAILYIFVRTHT